MAHELFGNRFTELQGNGRQPAWHYLGTTFTEPLTAQEAFDKAGLNYRIGKFPVAAHMGTKKDGSAAYLNIPDQYAILREKTADDPEIRSFGIVSNNYTLFQNSDIANMLDRLPKGKWHIETCGALGHGETIFASLAAGSFEVAGDEINRYFSITDVRDGTGSISFLSSAVRIVCANTLKMALETDDKVSLQHSKAARAETDELLRIFAHLLENSHQQAEALESLTRIPVTEAIFETLSESVYPDPPMPRKLKLAQHVDGAIDTPVLSAGIRAYELSRERVRAFRVQAMDLFNNFNDGFQ